jgi:hypothetical protein
VLPRIEEVGSDERAPAAEVASSVANLAQAVCHNAKALGSDVRIGIPDEISTARLETSNRHFVARTLMGRGALAACVAIVVTAAAIATVRPWILTGPASSNAAALPQSLPVVVPASGAAEPAAASPVIPNEVENKFAPGPIQSAPENALQAEKETADSTGVEKPSTRESAEPKVVVRKPLTPEEKGAIARGIQEMEKAASQASAQFNRR